VSTVQRTQAARIAFVAHRLETCARLTASAVIRFSRGGEGIMGRRRIGREVMALCGRSAGGRSTSWRAGSTGDRSRRGPARLARAGRAGPAAACAPEGAVFRVLARPFGRAARGATGGSGRLPAVPRFLRDGGNAGAHRLRALPLGVGAFAARPGAVQRGGAPARRARAERADRRACGCRAVGAPLVRTARARRDPGGLAGPRPGGWRAYGPTRGQGCKRMSPPTKWEASCASLRPPGERP
jgi:hypothetical protein